MATVKDVFRRGIATANWDDIVLAYEAITKEKAPPPPQPTVNIDVLDQEIGESQPQNVLDTELSEDDDDEDEDKDPSPPPRKMGAATHEFAVQNNKRVGKKKARLVPFKKRKNRKNGFVDDLTLHDDELVTKYPHLGVASPRPRNQRKALGLLDTGGTVSVQCALCGVTANVSPMLATGYNVNPEENTYRCDECCTPSGRRRAPERMLSNNDEDEDETDDE